MENTSSCHHYLPDSTNAQCTAISANSMRYQPVVSVTLA